MLIERTHNHTLESVHAFFVERMQQAGREHAPGEILLHLLTQLKVLVDDLSVELDHTIVRLGRRAARRVVELVHVVLLARSRGGRRHRAHQVHEPRAWVRRELPAGENVRCGAACETRRVERAAGQDGRLGFAEVRDVAVILGRRDVVGVEVCRLCDVRVCSEAVVALAGVVSTLVHLMSNLRQTGVWKVGGGLVP